MYYEFLLYYSTNKNFKQMKSSIHFKFFFVFIFALTINLVYSQNNRPIDCNGINPQHPTWGTTNDTMIFKTQISYADGISEPTGQSRMNPRRISNEIFTQEGLIPDTKNLSDYTFVWGQFMDHDITLVLDDEHETANVQVPKFDAWMDPDGTGQAIIPILRSLPIEGTGTSIDNPRMFANSITAFLDGSNVYGSDPARATWLRKFVDGKLKTSKGNMLPYNTTTGEYDAPIDPNAPFMAMIPGDEKWFVAGDIRANENILLTSMHTTFVREHNRQCDLIKAKHPDWTDEQIYQKARKIVGALEQSICYNEWLPTMGIELAEYTGFNPDVTPQISNVFSAAAFRYGHSVINSRIIRMDEHGHPMPGGDMRLAQAFFQPHAIRESEGVECFLKGMCYQTEQDLDCKMINDLRNMLFGPPGAGGMDLASINMQRGRERGLPDYNTIRQNYGLTPYTDFDQITDDRVLVQKLYDVYNGDINNIDPWVGMLAEKHLPNSIFGELLQTIISDQFLRIRNGDPFFYLNDSGLSGKEKDEISNTRLGDVVARTSGMQSIPNSIFVAEPTPHEVRAITEINNNLDHPDWGSTESKLIHFVTNGFADGISQPGGQNRPNPRVISNAIFAQEGDIYDNLELSDFSFVWGQFVDHDITLVPDGNEPFIIHVPKGDKWFDPNETGNAIIPVIRSKYDELSGTSPDNPRQYRNEITAYLDASNIYGSTDERAAWLRTFEGGKLKTSEDNLLPYNTVTGYYNSTVDPDAPAMDHPVTPADGKWFVSGDVRANENPLLTTLHTLFMREHNRICDFLAEKFPRWSDERLYQEARRIVIAEEQNITFNEWLPAIGVHLDEYEGYKPDVNPQILNLFSTASFRYGHSVLNGSILRFNDNCTVHENGHTELKYGFFNPSMIKIETKGKIEPYFLGMMHQRAQGLDCKLVDDVRNYLFGPPGAGGMDLASINMQRGRERGLPDYNTIRQDFGLQPRSSFATFSNNLDLNQKLYEVYGDVNDVDPWVGLLAEDHLPGSLFGDLGLIVMKRQFSAIRDGDRFFFEIEEGLSEAQKREIRYTTLADIITKNTDLENIPNNVFYYQGICTDVIDLANNKINVNIYPNPASTYVSLDISSLENIKGQIKVFSILGQVELSENINIVEGDNSINLNISNLPNGLYTVSFISEKGSFSKKIIKQ